MEKRIGCGILHNIYENRFVLYHMTALISRVVNVDDNMSKSRLSYFCFLAI